ncbi:MAG: helix-turn-helix domain-containing protein, partial [Oceanihabitans sp.]
KHIYRQDNPIFINILNEIRTNTLSEDSAKELNKRYLPNFETSKDEGYISLTTHNHKAETINQQELEKLKSKPKKYTAVVEGKFPEYSFPNKENLTLKVGAQVMFIKNDSTPEKRYFNGKIGKVIYLDKDEVVVKCPDDEFNIITKAESWENINYTVNQETKAITENKVGAYTQIPLRLAWSITIHKSQGLTFEKAIIDAQGAFAHGQTYVALSRCKSLEGLVLKSKINASQIISDNNVILFNKNAEENQPNDSVLNASKAQYQLNLISEVFHFYAFLYPINRLLDIYYKNKETIAGDLETPLKKCKTTVTNLLKIANSFNTQLTTLSNTEELPETNTIIQDRFTKAIQYFNKETKENIEEAFKKISFTTDNKAIEKDLNKQLDTLEELLTTKLIYFKTLAKHFQVSTFLELRAKAVFLKKEKAKNTRKTVIDGTTNVELFESLRELRNRLASKHDLIHYQIFTQKALYEMCETLPLNKHQLKQINGMGKIRIEKYGSEILAVIKDFCDNNNIETSNTLSIFEEKKPKAKKGETKNISLKLFKAGKSIEAIASERELNENTIFGHLASFIATKEISITDLISKAHYKELKKIIPKHTFENLSDLKHQLDEKYTYGEIRLVLEELSK